MKAKTKTAARVRKQLRRHIKLTFVPHGANQYRPHLIRAHGLLIVLLLVVGVQLGYTMLQTNKVLGATQPIAVNDLLTDTNNERAARGLPTLAMNQQLSKAAFLKAQDMFKQQYWAHTAPDGTTPWHWFGAVGYDYDYAGENLAKNFGSATAVMTAWMASPEHRSNILDAHYTQIGLAVMNGTLQGKDTTLVVALYGEPVATTAAAGTVAGPSVASTAAPSGHDVSLATRVLVAAQSFTPAALIVLIVLTITSGVAAVAHFYRRKLPKQLRQTWYRHHAAYKAVGLLSLIVIVVSLYSGGQI